MGNVIVFVILAVVLGGAVAYIVKARKKGVKCIGCPAAGSCSHGAQTEGCGGCSGCSHNV